MSRIFNRVVKKAGSAPGTLVYVGRHTEAASRVTLIDYDDTDLDERTVDSVEDVFAVRDSKRSSWINLDGLTDTEALGRLTTHFGVHPLVQEDIVNTHQRPKFEGHDAYLYLVFRMLSFDDESGTVESEQVSILIGAQWLISFQERQGDVFEPIRDRLRKCNRRIRTKGTSYLAYALLDAAVDNYFVVLEKVGERIEDLEQSLMRQPEQGQLESIHHLKREMILMRRAIWPLRELVGNLVRSDSPLLQEGVEKYLSDVYDHAVQVVDAVEAYRDVLSGLQDLYLSSISNRMNEVMKVLTIIATIFVPLTFVAGIYGMNFENMPELQWRWGYPVFWGIIVILGSLMLVYFRRKRWL